MSERRDFLQLATLLSLAVPATQLAAAEAPAARGEIARFPLGGALAGMDAVLVDLRPRPGNPTANAPGHRHPGFVLGYVIEGSYAFAIEGETPRVVNAGETFFEEAGALHSSNASADPNKPAHVLAFMVVKSGEQLVLPA